MPQGLALVQDADTINQAVQFRRPESQWYGVFAGQFRAAMLYSRGLVLLDTQVFDGAVLLALGPHGLREMLGAERKSPDVVISLRHPTAKASLEAMDTPGFLSSLDGLGWDRAEIARRRKAWVQAIDHDGLFVTSTRASDFPFLDTLRERLAEWSPPLPEGLEAEVIATTRRSDAHTAVRAALGGADESGALLWYNSAYMDVIALQHGATWMDSPAAAHETLQWVQGAGELRQSTPIPDVVVSELGAMTGSAFATLRTSARPILDSYYRRPSWLNGRRLSLVVLKATAPSFPVIELALTVVRVIGWFVVIFLVFNPPEVAFPTGASVLIAIVVAALQVPLSDLLALAQYARRKTWAFIRRPIP